MFGAGHKVLAVLDWELSTLGHPLADLAYSAMPYHLPAGVEALPSLPKPLPAGAHGRTSCSTMRCSLQAFRQSLAQYSRSKLMHSPKHSIYFLGVCAGSSSSCIECNLRVRYIER